MKILVFGNSGSGKSTYARALAAREGLAHLDSDSIVWGVFEPGKIPEQRDQSAHYWRLAMKTRKLAKLWQLCETCPAPAVHSSATCYAVGQKCSFSGVFRRLRLRSASLDRLP